MITRDNYEEFFLLYTDDELSAAERDEVESFVADHPDLREEWEALLQCRISPDARLAFPDHATLLRPELERAESTQSDTGPLLSETGPLLYYVDGLPFLYPDDSIVFRDKDLLYRSGKERRVIVLPWLRVGIAAAVVAAVALVFLLRSSQQNGHPDQSVVARTTTSKSVAAGPSSASVAAEPTTSASVAKAPNTKVSPTVTSTPAPTLHFVEVQPKTKQGQPFRKSLQRQPDQIKVIAVNSNPKVGPAVTRSTIDPRKGIDQPRPDISVGDVPERGSLASNVHFAVQTGIPKDQSSFATRALEDEQAGIGREDEFAPDQQPAPAKTKLRGIFRKVTRVFAKTADRDNDGNRQVLVGAFQVTLN